ncbi:hypothetical protein I6G82_17705 [Lysinibacillus macroides]|uniref:Uncharacterized protein n=1 Tax=Lysinibacillus macroides TaxID=33935 RepID=A0A0M9DMS0_9BACI|nr:hypothetical protein [Lysinibacillus macroides]KOY83803.1 hypothetical protein ADM90_02585 [Lysinibacillus macroides]QPR67071.1 hypothetical protein I6G82_17705 [Lysinibacillus macroides]
MAITEATLGIYVEELQPCLKNIYELEDKMTKCKEGIDSIIAKLIDEDLEIRAWIGDQIFRTDNPERKAVAIKLLKELKNELSRTTIDLNILKHDIQDELNSLLMEFQDWRKYFKNTLPLISLSIVMPSYKTVHIDKGIAFILFVANQCFGKIKVLNSLIRKLSALAALAAVLYLIAGIIQGEMRKTYFENIQAETNQAKKDLAETKQQIDVVQNQVNAFFKDVTKAFQATGLLQVIYTNHRELVFLVKEQSNVLRRWSDQFNAMKRMSERGMELATAASIAAEVLCKNPADHNELQKITTILLGSYLMENEATLTEVANMLKISVEQAKKVKAMYLLFNKHAPIEIAEALDMEIQEVEFIEEANKEVLASVA